MEKNNNQEIQRENEIIVEKYKKKFPNGKIIIKTGEKAFFTSIETISSSDYFMNILRFTEKTNKDGIKNIIALDVNPSVFEYVLDIIRGHLTDIGEIPIQYQGRVTNYCVEIGLLEKVEKENFYECLDDWTIQMKDVFHVSEKKYIEYDKQGYLLGIIVYTLDEENFLRGNEFIKFIMKHDSLEQIFLINYGIMNVKFAKSKLEHIGRDGKLNNNFKSMFIPVRIKITKTVMLKHDMLYCADVKFIFS